MNAITHFILLFYTWHRYVEGVVARYHLLNSSTPSDAAAECTTSFNGEIIIFRNFSSIELEKIFDRNISIRIWNGFQYTSGLVENTGCYNNTSILDGRSEMMANMSIYYCDSLCKKHAFKFFGLKESKCQCLSPNRMTPSFFKPADVRRCSHKCNMRPDEFCGSDYNSTFYNIYSVSDRSILNDADISETGSCLVYKRKGSKFEIASKNCDETLTSKLIACHSSRHNVDPTPMSWTDNVYACLKLNKSYPVSYNDTRQVNTSINETWLNDRNYTAIVEKKENHANGELCEILTTSRGSDWNVKREQRPCSDTGGAIYICKTDQNGDGQRTSTLSYPQSRKSTTVSHFSTGKTSKDQNGDGQRTSTLSYPQSRKSTTVSYFSTGKTSKGITSTGSTSTPSLQNVSSNFSHSPIEAFDGDDGSIIGGAIGALIVILVTGGIIIILVVRKRHQSCKDQSEYQSQTVNFSKSNGLTNMAYCSEATLNIIQGNPDRISQEYTTIKDELRNSQEYTTIQDEKLQSIRVSNTESDTFENKNQTSPTNGSLYMVLEETHSKSEICNPPNYELAQPISSYGGKENASLHPDGREQKEGAMDYDHLRQEAYKKNMAEENVYNHAETDNDYSHISQVTKTNKNHTDDDDDDNDYDHTGNVQNHEVTSNTGNDQDDTYAHAGGDGRTVDDQTDDDDDDDYAHTQTKENHHQTSIMRIDQDDTYAHAGGDGTTADGMRDIGPYDLAQNVRRPDDDSKEYSDNIRVIGSYEDAHYVNRPDVDDQESSNDMREIGPYEFAYNVDRRENGTTESTQDTFVQLGTEEGNYSLAEPIDMDNNGKYG